MNTLVEWLSADPSRCEHGYAPVQLAFCADCSEQDEYATFTAALRSAARGTEVHQRDVRPLIQHIPHKHRGLLYRRARQEGLIREIGMEPSTDVAGRNGDKLSRIYELRVATDVVGGSRSGSRPVGTGYAQCGFESPPACKLPPITPAVAWPSPDSAS